MQKHLYALGFAVCVFSFAFGGCGSEVNTSGGAGSSSSGSSSSGSNLGPRQACYDGCHKAETANCPAQPTDGCNAGCDQIYANAAGQCGDALDALFECYLPYMDKCLDEPPVQCQPEADAANSCQAMYGCADGQCYGGGGPNGEETCGCTQTCMMKEYKTDCIKDAMGVNCTCTAGGMVVGTCQPDLNAPLECGVQSGCCAAIFFPK